MAISIAFQKRITELAEECEVNKSTLPSVIGVDYRSLSNALNYGIIPSPRILIRIADYFGFSIKYILGESNDEYFSRANNPGDFGTRFCELCEERKVTHYKVCKDLYIDNSYVTRWLNKKYLPSFEYLEAIADYFNVSLDYLLGRTDER